jgi:ribose transport system substrate-binding protein
MLRTLLLVSSFVVAAACGGSSAAAPASGKPRLVVIPKGTTHVFWQAVAAGARAGGEAAGVEVVWKGPLQEDSREQQIQLVQQFVGEGVAGIALAPLDHAALVPSVRAARARGIEVVVFDSDLDGQAGKDYASFVATDNRAAGELAGRHLAQLLAGKGKVAMLRYQVGSASTEAREEGFLAAARAGGLEVVVDNRYAGASVGEAKTTALNLADTLRGVQGVFCSNEPTTVGMVQALAQLELVGKVQVVGFDCSPPIVQALSSGQLAAIVVQDPRRMGELAVRHLADAVAKKPVPPRVDTGAVLATKANMQEPAIRKLLE